MNNTTLPTQGDTDLFLSEFFTQAPSGKFYLARLTQEAKDFFGVTDEDAALTCAAAHGQTGPETTRLEQFVHWGCIHLLNKKTIKRTGPNEYQHMAGPDKMWLTEGERQNIVNEAVAFFKHSRKLGFSRADAELMWSNRWDADTTQKAAEIAFA